MAIDTIWRLVCPNGHHSIAKSSNHNWYCKRCKKTFDKLFDKKSEQMVNGYKDLKRIDA